MRFALTNERKVIAICAETGISLATVRRWLNGVKVHGSTDYAIRQAVEKLGIDARPRDRRSDDTLLQATGTTGDDR